MWGSLVIQWLRINLPMQETRVWSLVQEDPTCHRATKLMSHNYWTCALDPASRNYWAHVPQLLKPSCPRSSAPQQEKPPQWEAWALQWRVAPTCHNQRKSVLCNKNPAKPINRQILFKKKIREMWFQGVGFRDRCIRKIK